MDNYEVGTYIQSRDPVQLGQFLNTMLEDKIKLEYWAQNSIKAAFALNWQMEEQKLFDIYSI